MTAGFARYDEPPLGRAADCAVGVFRHGLGSIRERRRERAVGSAFCVLFVALITLPLVFVKLAAKHPEPVPEPEQPEPHSTTTNPSSNVAGRRSAATTGGSSAFRAPISIAATNTDRLAGYLGIQKQVAAARSALSSNRSTVAAVAGKVGLTLPPATGQLVIMRSSSLKTVQDVASDISGLAVLMPIIAIGLFAFAVWLSRGRRRHALRTVGWCFVVGGIAVLVTRNELGNDIVNSLVKLPENRPAAHDAWSIATQMLHDIGIAVVAYGLILVVAAWLAGETRLASALRRTLAPTLRTRPVPVYGTVGVALLLVILWGPTPATRKLGYIALFAILLALGVEALRRQAAAEFPNAQAGDTRRALHAWFADLRRPPAPADGRSRARSGGGHVADLERLSQLHERGSLTDAEFEHEKSVLLHAP